MNNLTLIGRVVTEITLRESKNNNPYCFVKIANDTGFGENKKTNFINCVAYGNRAETIQKYVKKGDRFGIVGQLTVTYDPNTKIETHSVIINEFMFLNDKRVEKVDAPNKQEQAPVFEDDSVLWE